MYREEGIKGLYRGFSSFTIGISLYLMIVPAVMFIYGVNHPLMGHKEFVEE
jgi:hypothetical protein